MFCDKYCFICKLTGTPCTRYNAITMYIYYQFLPCIICIHVAPSPPSNVSVSQIGLGTLLVSWTSGDPTVTGYIIYYQKYCWWRIGYCWRHFLTAGANNTNSIITGLIAGDTYSVSVASTSGTLPSTGTAAPNNITIESVIICNNYTAVFVVVFKSRPWKQCDTLYYFQYYRLQWPS